MIMPEDRGWISQRLKIDRDRLIHNTLIRMGDIDGTGQWNGTDDPRFITYAKNRYGYWGYIMRLWRSLFGRRNLVWIERK